MCLVDIGGGTSDIAIFTDGSIRHTGVIPIAGDQVTNDIAMALRTPTQHAEEIKIRYACALTQLAGADETIKVPSVGDRPPTRLIAPVARGGGRAALRRTVHPHSGRNTAFRVRGNHSCGRGLDGGTSKMEGAVELAEEIFHMPVRIGSPNMPGA